jgi:hypothetical protein
MTRKNYFTILVAFERVPLHNTIDASEYKSKRWPYLQLLCARCEDLYMNPTKEQQRKIKRNGEESNNVSKTE